MLDGRHHGEGKHDQRDMPMPAMPRPGLVVIETELVLGGLEAVLDRPTAALNADERVYRSSCRAPCGEVSEISISDIAPDQQTARPQAMVLRSRSNSNKSQFGNMSETHGRDPSHTAYYNYDAPEWWQIDAWKWEE